MVLQTECFITHRALASAAAAAAAAAAASN